MAKYFKDIEFECPCGCGLKAIDPEFVGVLDIIRGDSGFPFHVNSGCRCDAHNEATSGALHSPHKPDKKGICHAVDIKVIHSGDRFRIIQAALKAGVKRIGIASNFIHLDNMDDDKHVSRLIWHYKR